MAKKEIREALLVPDKICKVNSTEPGCTALVIDITCTENTKICTQHPAEAVAEALDKVTTKRKPKVNVNSVSNITVGKHKYNIILSKELVEAYKDNDGLRVKRLETTDSLKRKEKLKKRRKRNGRTNTR